MATCTRLQVAIFFMIKSDWVEFHKSEIEVCAYQIYLMREHYYQPDEPVRNFERAIEIVYERHNRVITK